jgi:hypothetical protein
MTALVYSNSPESIQSRLAEGRIPRFGPILMLFARPALILLVQGITFLLFKQLNVHNALSPSAVGGLHTAHWSISVALGS